MSELNIQEGYRPGLIGRIAELHAVYYSRHWRFGSFFEAKVASGLSEFVNRFDREADGLWSLTDNGRIEAGLAIDGSAAPDMAHLRWFIVNEKLQGRGIGGQLLSRALAFCRQRDYRRVYLWTFQGLDAARHLYEKYGFRLTLEEPGAQWGTPVTEQKFVADLSA